MPFELILLFISKDSFSLHFTKTFDCSPTYSRKRTLILEISKTILIQNLTRSFCLTFSSDDLCNQFGVLILQYLNSLQLHFFCLSLLARLSEKQLLIFYHMIYGTFFIVLSVWWIQGNFCVRISWRVEP